MVGLDLIEYYEKLRTKVETLQTLDLSFCSKQAYKDIAVDRDSLQQMIGKVEEINFRTMSAEMISSFQHQNMVVGSISLISSEEAWFTFQNAKEFTLLHRDGYHIKSVIKNTSSLNFIPCDGGFLVCKQHKNKILKADMSGKLSIWRDTSPLRSYGEDGITSVLTDPCDMAQNHNSDVCVVNKYEIAKDKWRGNVCVLYEDGGLRFVYNGHGGDFNPCEICCDLFCNILCVNIYDAGIHVINREGCFVKYLFTSGTCIPHPRRLVLHRSILWVGSKAEEIRVYRYPQ